MRHLYTLYMLYKYKFIDAMVKYLNEIKKNNIKQINVIFCTKK